MRGSLLLTFAIVMTLSACSSSDKGEGEPTENGMIVENDAASAPILPDNGGLPAPAEATSSQPGPATDTAASANAIPPALRGRWGLVPKDCTTLHGDAKGLLEISATRLTFYESRGDLTKISEQEPTRIKADFAFSGEGQTWSSSFTLAVQDGAQSLILQNHSTRGSTTSHHYTRCGG